MVSKRCPKCNALLVEVPLGKNEEGIIEYVLACPACGYEDECSWV